MWNLGFFLMTGEQFENLKAKAATLSPSAEG
jgi:hypothetical protein